MFRPIQIIDRGTYGWSEFITAQGCTAPEEIERFYERQGAYIALFYALEATNVHFENLIAHGEYPIMIDLESLFHPRLTGTWSQTSQYCSRCGQKGVRFTVSENDDEYARHTLHVARS